MADLTPYQQKIVKRYYDNRESLARQRLAELVGELYLSEGKKRQRVWANIVTQLEALGLPAKRIEHLKAQDNPALLAEIVKDIEAK
jgi:hypothetical protein